MRILLSSCFLAFSCPGVAQEALEMDFLPQTNFYNNIDPTFDPFSAEAINNPADYMSRFSAPGSPGVNMLDYMNNITEFQIIRDQSQQNSEAPWGEIVADLWEEYNNTTTPEDKILGEWQRLYWNELRNPRSNTFNPSFLADSVQPVSLNIDEDFNRDSVRDRSAQIFNEGAVFTSEYLSSQVSQSALTEWLRNPSVPIDLNALGLSQPEGPVEVYALSDDGVTASSIIVQPAGVPLSEVQKAALENARTYRKSLSRWGEKLYSSIQDVMSLAVETVCKSAFRPSDFSIELSGSGNVVLAELGVQISADFKSEEVCTPFIVTASNPG